MRSRRPRRKELFSNPRLLGIDSPLSSDTDQYPCDSSCSSDSFTSYEQSLSSFHSHHPLRQHHSDISLQLPELPLPPNLTIRPLQSQNIREMSFSEYATEEFPDLAFLLHTVFPSLSSFHSNLPTPPPPSPSIRSPKPPLPPNHKQRKSPQLPRKSISQILPLPSLPISSLSSSSSSSLSRPKRTKSLSFSEDPPEEIVDKSSISRANSMPISSQKQQHYHHSRIRPMSKSFTHSPRVPLRSSNRINAPNQQHTRQLRLNNKKDSVNTQSPVSENTYSFRRRRRQSDNIKEETTNRLDSRSAFRRRSSSLPPCSVSARSLRIIESTHDDDNDLIKSKSIPLKRNVMFDKDSDSFKHSFLMMGLANLFQDAMHNNEHE